VRTDAGIRGRDGAVRLRAALRVTFSTIVLIWADGGYAGRLVRWAQRVLGVTVGIVKRTDDLTGFQVIPRRWVLARTLARISEQPRCVRPRDPAGARRGDGLPRQDHDHLPLAGPVSECQDAFRDDAADTRP
jgi:transposase